MADLPTVGRITDGYARVGEAAQSVDTIHSDTAAAVAEERAAEAPPAEADETEE